MTSTDLVVPGIQELVALDDAPSCARALAGIRILENQLKDAKRQLVEAIVAESERVGSKTIQVGNGYRAIVKGGSKTVFDTEILEELVAAGLPQERFDELVRAEIIYKVDARVAKQIEAANPVYGEIIGRARQEHEAPFAVDVTK